MRLTAYDLDTALQPSTVLVCYGSEPRRVCAGWAGCHDTRELLALRLAAPWGTMAADDLAATHRYVSPAPLFSSGREAAVHGAASLADPSPAARALIAQVAPRIEVPLLGPLVATLPVPEPVPVDGDCLIWAPATARRLAASGVTAAPVSITGWADPAQVTIAFVHCAVAVDLEEENPAHRRGPYIVDVTARQFAGDLPERWVADWSNYAACLARATGAFVVTSSLDSSQLRRERWNDIRDRRRIWHWA
ncbi:hypothetical protein Asi02nite_37370 [Asanoa siamensis]|uniref:Uncharacterized protein n=1 Tax=Asanoa siamensis TaxID=926357 RepID=A0ABQ4CSF2_9ACTN|nr:hypothetical protein Asi02nite_37370 [Asanoa siamensis]